MNAQLSQAGIACFLIMLAVGVLSGWAVNKMIASVVAATCL